MSITPDSFRLKWTEQKENNLFAQGYKKISDKSEKGSLRGGDFCQTVTYRREPTAFESLCCATCLQCLCCLEPKPKEIELFRVWTEKFSKDGVTYDQSGDVLLKEKERDESPFWYCVHDDGKFTFDERGKKELKAYIETGWNSASEKFEKRPNIYYHRGYSYFLLVQRGVVQRIMSLVSKGDDWEDLSYLYFYDGTTGFHKGVEERGEYEIKDPALLRELINETEKNIDAIIKSAQQRLIRNLPRNIENVSRVLKYSEEMQELKKPLLDSAN